MVLTALIFQSCHLSTSKFEKDQSIDAATRQEIKNLNDKLFEGITKNDLTTVQSLLSPGLLEKFGNDTNKLINVISSRQINNYSILDEYSVQASGSKINIVLPSGSTQDNDYTFTFESPNKDSYVSLLLLNNLNNQFLLTAVYGKYKNEWKLNILKFGEYSFLGKTAYDYFIMAKQSAEKSYLIDAVNNILVSIDLLQPSGSYFHFLNEKEIKEFGDSLLQQVNNRYKFPMTLSGIKTQPQLFRIFPQVMEDGFFPMVYYRTGINLKDTTSLKLEKLKIRKVVDSIFTGIDKDKKFIFYWAFNEMPDGKKLVDRYGFVDSLNNK
jgi:hypothetical protein